MVINDIWEILVKVNIPVGSREGQHLEEVRCGASHLPQKMNTPTMIRS